MTVEIRMGAGRGEIVEVSCSIDVENSLPGREKTCVPSESEGTI